MYMTLMQNEVGMENAGAVQSILEPRGLAMSGILWQMVVSNDTGSLK